MSTDLDWEKQLREGEFDLPAPTWQRMENDLRAWLAQESRSAARPASPIASRWFGWLARPVWAASFAGLILAAVLAGFWFAPSGNPLAWKPGEGLDVAGAKWNWRSARCRVEGPKARLRLESEQAGNVAVRLEQGVATFRVDHRRSGESFRVDLGDCQVHVVGTTFTVGLDSVRAWVSVQEGRIRLEAYDHSEFVSAGHQANCPERIEPSQGIASVNPSGTVPVADSTQVSLPGPSPKHPGIVPAAEKVEVAVPGCNEPGPCIATLSEFVRLHPAHASAPAVALRWARLASDAGDPRDALIAYGYAATSPKWGAVARLEALRVRFHALHQSQQVADSLDAWIPNLAAAEALRAQVIGLRIEVYRRSGDESGEARLQKLLDGDATAESRGR